MAGGPLATSPSSAAGKTQKVILASGLGHWLHLPILGDIGSEIAATTMSERYGIPGMLVRIGIGQAAIIALLVVIGGRPFWTFGLRVTPEVIRPRFS